MSKLLIYIGEGQRFDLEATVLAISSIDGVSNIRRGAFIGAVFECDYSYAGRKTVVRISEDLETVTVEGLGEEAVDFAIKFQKCNSIPLNVIDMDYSFNLELPKFQSRYELMSAMQAA